MPNVNTIVSNLGCFGMFTCYDEQNKACANCSVQQACKALAEERYQKMENIIEAELD